MKGILIYLSPGTLSFLFGIMEKKYETAGKIFPFNYLKQFNKSFYIS